MREIIAKYEGTCRKCGKPITAGDTIAYEKRMGVFCPLCAPASPDEIREYRQEAADRKAARYEEWAEKREKKAEAQLTIYPSMRHDHAFITQPGHIPARARMNRADDAACSSLQVAQAQRDKADRLRSGVRVKGDADARRAAKREAVLAWLTVGQVIETSFYGRGKVLKINQKTAKIGECGASGTYVVNVPLHFLRPAMPA